MTRERSGGLSAPKKPGDLPRVGKVPCGSCPYRRDVPAGIWAAEEYLKLPGYDGETLDQLLKDAVRLFFCHQDDGKLCAGWAACHDTDHLLALRLHPVHPSTFGYVSPVPVFSSGAEAALHGLAGVENPGDDARAMMRKIESKRAKE